MNISNYQELINNKEYINIYDNIKSKVDNLIKDIASLLNIKIDSYDYKDIQYQIQSKTLLFSNINVLCNILDNYHGEELIDNINIIINNYNLLLSNIEKYLNKEKEVNNTKDTISDIFDNFRILFKTMLRYKNKEYNTNWDYKELLNKIDLYYAYFNKEIKIISSLLNSNEIIIDSDLEIVTITDIEKILLLEEIYNKISDEYKDYAYLYPDIELEENQSFEDLLDLEDSKYEELYKEMLDYKNISYEDEDIELLIYKFYPQYKKDLDYVHSALLHSKSPVEIINTMEITYNKIKDNYNNS